LQKHVDTLIVIPNQNLFRIANDKTTFADAFGMADQVLYSGVACITDLMVKEGLINLDFADVRSVMRDMGKAMMGTGEASGEGRAMQAAEAAISNPLLDETSMLGAQGLLISITGGRDLTLFEVDEAATRIREEVDQEANIILGATFDEGLEGVIRVSVVATGIDNSAANAQSPAGERRVEAVTRRTTPATEPVAPAPAQDASMIEKIGRVAASLALPEKSGKVERDGVSLEPFKPSTSLFSDPSIEDEFKAALEEELMPKDGDFVPPAAVEPGNVIESAGIPDIQDFPPMVQAQVDASRTASQRSADEGQGPKGLLQKLKSGFGVLDTDNAPVADTPAPQTVAPVLPTPAAAEASELPPAQPAASRVDDNPYAPRRGQLDAMGRINPSEKTIQEDDQLDIPAFLRRQAN